MTQKDMRNAFNYDQYYANKRHKADLEQTNRILYLSLVGTPIEKKTEVVNEHGDKVTKVTHEEKQAVGDQKLNYEFMSKLVGYLRNENTVESLIEKEKAHKVKTTKEQSFLRQVLMATYESHKQELG